MVARLSYKFGSHRSVADKKRGDLPTISADGTGKSPCSFILGGASLIIGRRFPFIVGVCLLGSYSHSIVAGGLEEIS